MTNRLIQGVSNLEQEEKFVSNYLAVASGEDFIKIPRAMLIDINTSHNLATTFNEEHYGYVRDSYPFSVLVLTRSNWSIREIANQEQGFIPPPEYASMIQSFTAFYMERQKSRTLIWADTRSSGLMTYIPKSSYLGRPLRITASIYQIAILLEYQMADVKTFAELQLATGLSPESMQKLLEVLVRAQLLRKNGENYTRNEEYKKRTLFINMPLYAKAIEVSPEAAKDIDRKRGFRLQAWAVQEMKTKKIWTRQELTGYLMMRATTDKTGFSPEKKLIDENINYLIEHDYLQQIQEQEQDQVKLKYIA